MLQIVDVYQRLECYRRFRDGYDYDVKPGEWYPVLPPIVASPPEPSPKEDAEWLRQYVSGVFIAPETKARAERIAARLERLKEGE